MFTVGISVRVGSGSVGWGPKPAESGSRADSWQPAAVKAKRASRARAGVQFNGRRIVFLESSIPAVASFVPMGAGSSPLAEELLHARQPMVGSAAKRVLLLNHMV